jgi:hypothetical protein
LTHIKPRQSTSHLKYTASHDEAPHCVGFSVSGVPGHIRPLDGNTHACGPPGQHDLAIVDLDPSVFWHALCKRLRQRGKLRYLPRQISLLIQAPISAVPTVRFVVVRYQGAFHVHLHHQSAVEMTGGTVMRVTCAAGVDPVVPLGISVVIRGVAHMVSQGR